jgi:hypothetical protein
MSYSISLYDRNFLKRAIETGLGDWTGADPIPQEVIRIIIPLAAAEGFNPIPMNEEFAAFMREQGVEPGREFELETPTLLAKLTIHSGQIAFTIPYTPKAGKSIEVCARIARSVASECGLGYHDPQVGVADY